MSILDRFSLNGKVSIITGGERGIGFAIAKGFAEAGSKIVIAGMDEASMATATEELRAMGTECLAVKTDVTDEAQIAKMVQTVVDTFGHIDVLVNNAGSGRGNPAEKMPAEDFRWVLDINLTSQFLVSKAVGNVMLEQGKGSIVNIASMYGIIVNNPQPQCNYNTSKAGSIMLTKSLACEWAERGVRVNCISPGYTRTALIQKRFDNHDPILNEWLRFVPMNRFASPDELVGAALYLASDAASYTTGTMLSVDGGYTCW